MLLINFILITAKDKMLGSIKNGIKAHAFCVVMADKELNIKVCSPQFVTIH